MAAKFFLEARARRATQAGRGRDAPHAVAVAAQVRDQPAELMEREGTVPTTFPDRGEDAVAATEAGHATR